MSIRSRARTRSEQAECCGEEDLAAQIAPPAARSRLHEADAHQGRAARAQGAPPEGAEAPGGVAPPSGGTGDSSSDGAAAPPAGAGGFRAGPPPRANLGKRLARAQ